MKYCKHPHNKLLYNILSSFENDILLQHLMTLIMNEIIMKHPFQLILIEFLSFFNGNFPKYEFILRNKIGEQFLANIVANYRAGNV